VFFCLKIGNNMDIFYVIQIWKKYDADDSGELDRQEA
jgi:hypothetical protein